MTKNHLFELGTSQLSNYDNQYIKLFINTRPYHRIHALLFLFSLLFIIILFTIIFFIVLFYICFAYYYFSYMSDIAFTNNSSKD
jgi:hypothetical protein